VSGNPKVALLALLSRCCRGPAAARKVWRLAEDLRTLGLDADPDTVLAAVADLRRQGFPVVVTEIDVPRVYIEEPRRTRPRGGWPMGHRPRAARGAARPSAIERVSAGAEAACGQSVKATAGEWNEEGSHAPA
jgi:hypothetical protein